MKTKPEWRSLSVMVLAFLLIVSVVGCGVPKARTPDEVILRVKAGMTYSEVKNVVDLDYFERNFALAQFDFGKLEVRGGTVYYEPTQAKFPVSPSSPNIWDYKNLQEYGKALDEYDKAFEEYLNALVEDAEEHSTNISFIPPYWGWILGKRSQSRAFIGFEWKDGEDIVIVVTRI